MKKNKRRSRKKRGKGFFSFLLILIIIGIIIASVTMFCKTRTIEVAGAVRHTPEEIIAASGIETGDNLFAINKFEVIEKIKEAYPYVADVEIRRHLPDKFVFTVTERVPVAYVDLGEQRWLLDKEAYVLESFSISETLPYLHVVSESEAVDPHSGKRLVLKEEETVNALASVLTALSDAEVIANVNEVNVSKLYQLSFLYENRIQVQLGNTERIEKKVSTLAL